MLSFQESEDSDTEITAKTLASFKAHVPVPTQKEVEEAILERKKQELLARFVPDFDAMDYENDNNNEVDSVNETVNENEQNGESLEQKEEKEEQNDEDEKMCEK